MNTTELPKFRADCAAGRIAISSFSGGLDETLPTLEAAQAFVALLPKSCKALATTLSGPDYRCGIVNFHAKIAADGVNGGRNETGIKRYRTIRKALDKLGCQVEWTTPYTNSLTEAEAEERMA